MSNITIKVPNRMNVTEDITNMIILKIRHMMDITMLVFLTKFKILIIIPPRLRNIINTNSTAENSELPEGFRLKSCTKNNIIFSKTKQIRIIDNLGNFLFVAMPTLDLYVIISIDVIAIQI